MAANQAYYDARIASIDVRIAAYEAAALAFSANGAQLDYRYDSGQTTITVERADPEAMENIIDRLLNQRQIMCIRAGRARGSFNMRGGW